MQELLGHRNISTTQKYLGVNYADARAAVESIALITESDRRPKMYNSLKMIDDETLITELINSGYSHLGLPNAETIGEIVKNRLQKQNKVLILTTPKRKIGFFSFLRRD